MESINTINKFLQEHAHTDLETQTRQAKLHFQKTPKQVNEDNEDLVEPDEVTALNSTANTQTGGFETKSDTNPILCTDRFGNHYNFRVFIYCYTVGKEEVVLDLARYYKTKIVLDRDRYRMIKALNYYPEYFTNDPNEGFIHLTKGLNSVHKLTRNDVIHISLTGWVNCKSYLCLKKGEYQVAYSSHSNYEELDRFTAMIKPGIINPIVIERNEGMDLNEDGVKSMAGYYFWLRNFKKRGLDLLRKLTRREVREQAWHQQRVHVILRPRKTTANIPTAQNRPLNRRNQQANLRRGQPTLLPSQGALQRQAERLGAERQHPDS
jgi:hypothetical protein